jgi:hypothetical protein
MLRNEDNIIKDKIKNFRLLKEYVDRNEIIDAIENNDIIYIYYSGDKTVNRGYRTIEPYALGISKAGNLVLRAYQQAGASDSKVNPTRANDRIPGWRMFRVDGITTFMKTHKQFDGTKPRPNYNPNDKGMSEIIAAVQPNDDGSVNIGGDSSINKGNKVKQRLSLFDPQSRKFKDFYSASKNQDLITKKAIDDIYELVRFQHKKDPNNYIVVVKNGKFTIDKKGRESGYGDKYIGDLDVLYRKYNNIDSNTKVNKMFIDNQKKDFLRTLKKQTNI